MSEQPCLTCKEVKQTEKQRNLEQARPNIEEQGKAKAIAAGQSYFYIAAARNGTGWLIELERREDSTLTWELVSIL